VEGSHHQINTTTTIITMGAQQAFPLEEEEAAVETKLYSHRQQAVTKEWGEALNGETVKRLHLALKDHHLGLFREEMG
jgi:hypothetical protein